MNRILLYKYYVILLLFFPSLVFGQVAFLESANALGINNATYGEGNLGAGISFFDFDQDGWDDITMPTEAGQQIRFYKNTGGTFTLVDLGIDNTFETKALQWVDFDNDADYDLFVTSETDYSILYENDGNLNFTDITASAGLLVTNHKSWGASWGDYNNDGWLDLFLCSRDDLNSDLSNLLFKNNGDGTFSDVSTEAGISTNNFITFIAGFFDFNNDGWQDLFLANDKLAPNQLYKNNGDGTFDEIGESSGTGIVMDAMSTTIDDYDNDGWLDIYVTNTQAGNVFYKNNGDNTFTDIAASNGTLMESIAWGAVFLDADNDKDKDLYVSGMIDENTTYLSAAFYENDGLGMYTIPEGAGFENDLATSFSNAIGDLNNDGFADMVVLNFEPYNMFVWKNECPESNNWLKVKLEGTESNKQGVGSWIEISVNGEKQYNYTLCGEGYIGQNSAHEFFGIGDATTIDYVKVTWLSGVVDVIENPSINTAITIVEGTTLNTVDIERAQVVISPNPALDILKYNVPATLLGKAVTLTDIYGRIVVEDTIKTISSSLDIGNLSTGIYYVNIGEDKNKITKKVILL